MKKLGLVLGIFNVIGFVMIIVGSIMGVKAIVDTDINQDIFTFPIASLLVIIFGSLITFAGWVMGIVFTVKYANRGGFILATGICAIVVPVVGGIMAFFVCENQQQK